MIPSLQQAGFKYRVYFQDGVEQYRYVFPVLPGFTLNRLALATWRMR